jgi:thymidylate synthase (FAD)
MTELISITPDPEKVILYCARVSSDQSNTDVGLIRYLIKNNHWSPFEMAHAVFEIETSRAIAQQILRHRSFAFQEFSQRYSKVSGFDRFRGRAQAEKNRQSSTDTLSQEAIYLFYDLQANVQLACQDAYEAALAAGIAKEQARFLLPQSTLTKLYMAGSIRSWIHYFDVRCDEHTQLEHRIIAMEIRKLLAVHVPTIAFALDWQ